eukprot:SAG31_NODE_8005_length_1543_cov_1.380194_1_plen_21_part_10
MLLPGTFASATVVADVPGAGA